MKPRFWLFRRMNIIVQGKCVATSRFPWLHLNFMAWEGWREAFEGALRQQGHKGFHIIGRVFGYLLFCDFSHECLWKLPRIVKSTDDGYSRGVGWLYWAVYISKNTWYPNPRRYMPGFKDLPYASAKLAAEYYLHDSQEGTKEQWNSDAGTDVKEV